MIKIVLPILATLFVVGLLSCTTIPEGYVGVVFSFNALQNYTITPGLTYSIPIFRSVQSVQISVQTDEVLDVTCGTKSGAKITFKEIRVVNQLKKDAVVEMVRSYSIDYDKEFIFRRVEHELSQICSKRTLHQVYIEDFDMIDDILQSELQKFIDTHSHGLKIVSIRVTKPVIPTNVEEEYRQVSMAETSRLANEKKALNEMTLLRTKQDRDRSTTQHEREQKMLLIDAEMNEAKKRLSHEHDQQLMRRKTELEDARLLKDIQVVESERKRLLVDDETYKTTKANEAVLTLTKSDGYVQLEIARAMAQAHKLIYYGDSIPNYFLPTIDKAQWDQTESEIQRSRELFGKHVEWPRFEDEIERDYNTVPISSPGVFSTGKKPIRN